MAGKAMGLSGQMLDVGFDVDISAKIDYEWVTDERPTGWNYRTDNPTYSTSQYAAGSDVMVESVAFSTDSMFLIQDEEVPFHSVNKYIHPATLKQLLNPAIYSQGMSGAFQAQLEKLDPPEYGPDDDYEPDFDDRDY